MNFHIHLERAVENVGGDYVFSYKPNPAVLAADRWNPQAARDALRAVLDRARDGHVELSMKDISTVRPAPRRPWGRARHAMGLAGDCARGAGCGRAWHGAF